MQFYSTDASGFPKVPVIRVYEEGFAAAMDTAVSHALLRRVATQTRDASLRLYRPQDIVAFGKRDAVTDGFEPAVAAAHEHGFDSVVRLAGGRAAVFHHDTIAFALTVPSASPREGIAARFRAVSGLMAAAFRGLGVPARVGEVAGEYCPGEYSINAGGKKVMGIGQRLVAGAAHVGGVIVVDAAERIAEVLVPVYRALGLDWDPATAGDLASTVPGLEWMDVRNAVVDAFSSVTDLEPAQIPNEVLEAATALEDEHRPHHWS